jgi:hypothetical protein
MIEGTAPSSGRAEALGAGEDKPHFGVIHFGEFPGGDHGRALPVGATRSQLECQSPQPFGGLWRATRVTVLSVSDAGDNRRAPRVGLQPVG